MKTPSLYLILVVLLLCIFQLHGAFILTKITKTNKKSKTEIFTTTSNVRISNLPTEEYSGYSEKKVKRPKSNMQQPKKAEKNVTNEK